VADETRVAYQGERGAYSESAAISFFQSSIELKPCRELPVVFQSVEGGESHYGVVPVENSLEGSINQTYDLFLESSLKVCGEIVVKVTHCLIANPETELKSIRLVYSHPQALAQCRNYLERLGCPLIPAFDTAGSVKMLKDERITDAAAVASERAAKIYNMKILAKGIEDYPNNYTRFFVLSKEDAQPSGNDKTSVIFSTKHVPGALYNALKLFATRNINLTRIESRPTKLKPWEYNFYLDFEGHRSEETCRQALDDLEGVSAFVKILGSYPKALGLAEVF